MKKAVFYFSPELSVFLKPAIRGTAFEMDFNGPQSVKHLFEAAGVPHTEVSAVRVNGNLVGFDYLVQDSDHIEVFSFSDPSLRASGLGERSNPNFLTSQQPDNRTERLSDHPTTRPSDPRFILDNHLGKLASHMRMLGFDCLYKNDFQDDELALRTQQEARILLTRDHRLLMRKSIEQGYWLRSQDPRQQLKEVLVRYALFGKIKPFQRCMRCNQLLESVSKNAILPLLQPLTRQYFDEFRRCPHCAQIYWQGSHFTKMLAFIQDLARDHSS